jgi:hypothetical protein
MTEKDIQKYIWDHKNDWKSLLVNARFPTNEKSDNPTHLTPAEAMFNLVVEKTRILYNSLEYLEFFGCEVPLRKKGKSTIRADFLGIMGGGNGIAIIELKKGKKTERQSFTELLAYSGHLRTVFAPMGKMDIVYVIIAPMKERIVREAIVNCLLYENMRTIALVPEFENDDVSTLKLNPWIPSFKEIEQLTNSCFSERNFDVFKITWEALEGEWSPEKGVKNPDEHMIDRMNEVSAIAAQVMEAKGINGFVFSTQSFSETRELLPLANGLVLCGLNPYKATKNRFLKTERNLSVKEADNIDIVEVNLLDIIPELEKSAKNENIETNFLGFLSLAWDNEMTGIGFDIVQTLTKSLDQESIITDYGGFNWDDYQSKFLEDIYCHNFKMRLTGLLRKLFFEYAKLDYDYIREYGHEEHFQYADGDIPNFLVDISNSQFFVRNFIRRLFNPYYEFEDDFDLS